LGRVAFSSLQSTNDTTFSSARDYCIAAPASVRFGCLRCVLLSFSLKLPFIFSGSVLRVSPFPALLLLLHPLDCCGAPVSPFVLFFSFASPYTHRDISCLFPLDFVFPFLLGRIRFLPHFYVFPALFPRTLLSLLSPTRSGHYPFIFPFPPLFRELSIAKVHR